jgi:hypothetical protein
MTWKVGVVGYGFSAKIFHIPFITAVSNFKLHAIVQRTPKPDDDAQKDHPGVKGYRSADDMVKDADIDVVVITTAPDSHYYLTKLALEAGKHGMVNLFHVRRSVLANSTTQLLSRSPSPQPTKSLRSLLPLPRRKTSSWPSTKVRTPISRAKGETDHR